MLSYALFRWESAVTLGVMLILAVFVPDPFRGTVSVWRWWIWIVLGVLAEVLIVATTLADPDVRARLAGQLIRARFDLDGIADTDLRQQIVKALDTREQIEMLLQRTRDRSPGAQLEAMADNVSNWIAGMYALVRCLDDYRGDATLHRKRSSVPAEIRSLEKRLAGMAGAQSSKAKDRAELERALADRQAQWTELERLDKLVQSAMSKLDENQGALGTVYTQMQLTAAKDIASRRTDTRVTQQLRGDIADHTRSLSEVTQAVAEGYQQVSERG